MYPWNTPGPSSGSSLGGRRRMPWEEDDPAALPSGTEEDQSPSSWFTIPNALRIGGGVVGGLAGSFIPGAGTAVGAAAGGALGAGLGEGLAELLEVRRGQRKEINPLQIGTQAAIGAVPLGKIGGIASGALKGGMLGAGATVATNLAETGELPELRDVGRGALYGGAFGGAAAGIVGRFARPASAGRALEAAAAAEGERPRAVPPPPNSRFRSVVSPRFESFPEPPPVFPDANELAMAYQPTLPGAVQAGGRRMGGFHQEYGNLPALPEGFDELNRILAGEDSSLGDIQRVGEPSLERPLLPSGLDTEVPAIATTPRGTPAYPWMEPAAPREPLTRPAGPFASLERPLNPSGLDAEAAGIEQTGPPVRTRPDVSDLSTFTGEQLDAMSHSRNPDAALAAAEELHRRFSRNQSPHPSLTRPLNPSGLDVNPPALSAPSPLDFLGPTDERTGYARVPFPVADEAAQRALLEGANYSKPELRDVPLRELLATQETVTPSVVEDYIKNVPERRTELPVGAHGRMQPSEVNVVQGPDGKWYLAGGTHRATAALGRGEESIQAVAYPHPEAKVPPIPENLPPELAAAVEEPVVMNSRGTGPQPPPPGREGHFKLPEAKVSDAEYEAIRDKMFGIEPTPAALAERRGADIGPPSGVANRRAGRLPENAPVLDERGRVVAPPQPDAERPPGPWDQNTAPEAPARPEPVQTTVPTPSGRRVGATFEQVDPQTIKVDAKTYQFKGGGDAQGVTDRLQGVGSWDPIAGQASPVVIHERLDGSRYVVDGHQRVGLAKRMEDLGRPVGGLNAIVLKEADGVTVNQARRIGAMLNLQQGTGTATDVGKVLREAPLSDLERNRIPKDQTSGSKLRMGEDLSKLGDDAFARVINGQVHDNPARNEAYGAIVGRRISDPAEQVAALQQLAKAQPENAYAAEQFVKAIEAAGFEHGTQTNLFGEQEVANSLAEPISRVMAAARRTLQSEKSALGNAIRNEERLKAKGNVLNREANQAGVESAGALDRLLDTYGHTAGPVREELKSAAAAVQRGELTPAAAANRVLEAVERERANLGTPKPAVRAAVQPDNAPGRAPQQPAPAAKSDLPPELTATATPEEVPGILKQLADTINVKNEPVAEVPFSLQREVSNEPSAGRQASVFDVPEEETAAGRRKMARGDYGGAATQEPNPRVPEPTAISEPPTGASALPPELAEAAGLETRHEVRNPEKAGKIAESMKRVGWKGRPLLTIKDNGREIAWTGVHRLEAAKQAGLKRSEIPSVTVDAEKLRAAGYDVNELTKLGKKDRIAALRKAGENEAADLLEEERAAKQGRARREGSNPRAQGTNPRAQRASLKTAEELLDAGKVDEAERMMSGEIEEKIKSALKHGTGGSGSTLVGGLTPFDPETFRRLVAKHPESAWRATTSALGAATGWYMDDDHPGRGLILGALAGYGAGSVPRIVKALQTAEIKGRVEKGVAPVRMARAADKDIGLFELLGGTPERTIPDQFEKARPAFERFVKALHEEHARTKEIIPQKRVQALRDKYVTPVITDIRKDAKAASTAKQPYKSKYITAFANRLAGHRTIGQRVFQTLTKGKLPADFIERRIGGAAYYVGTGFGVDTALQNMTQPILALGHVPAKFLAQAYKDLATNPGAKRLVEGALLPLEKPADAIETYLGPFGQKVSKLKGKLPDPQKMLRMTDQKNREVVYYAARKFAESRGLETGAADTWARQVMRKTQTEPGAAGTNPFHAGPVMGSLRPFTKYPTVFTEHVLDLVKQASHGQNLAGAARLGGTLLGLSLLGKAAGIDLEDLLVSGGRPLGLDIQHPQRSLERIATGQATPATRAGFDLLEHLKGSADHSLASDAAGLAVPRFPRKLAEAVGHFQKEGTDQLHVSRGPGGKIRDVTTPGETVLNLLGVRTTRQTERRHALTDFYEAAGTAKDRYEAARRQAYEDLGRAIDEGDSDGAGDAMRRIGSAQAVRQFLRERRLLPEDRFFKTLPPKLRNQLRGQLDETMDLAPEGR